jgi:hypothetical protein
MRHAEHFKPTLKDHSERIVTLGPPVPSNDSYFAVHSVHERECNKEYEFIKDATNTFVQFCDICFFHFYRLPGARALYGYLGRYGFGIKDQHPQRFSL